MASSANFYIFLVLAALIACTMAQLLPISGTRDLTGGYYDHYTGQYSSALTGRVYNTAPAVVAAPAFVPRIAAPIAAPIAAAAAPVAWIRR